jgi:NAD(P)-dependent dehydrogenase (short-subunit alcohol dehydrogenase family)
VVYNLLVSSLFDVNGKVVLVTGGSRGIGEMIARGFVEAGAKVYISSRKADVGDALAKELSASGSCTSLPADLSTEAECQRLANEIGSREDHLDVLVNNAGATWGAPLDEYDEKAWERVLSLNVKGVFHLTKFLRPLLKITVNAIAPGPFPSKMMRSTLEAFGDEIAKAAPMKRIGQPSDMAGAAIFLASPAASYITGVILPVDGGIATLV